MKLTGKVALITGSGRGIGLGCALEMAREGAEIVLNDRPGSPDLAKAREQVLALGGKCHAIEADVFSRAGCEHLVQEAVGQAGRIDLLVSNPANGRRSWFLQTHPADFERVLQGTMIAGFHISQLVARHLVERKSPGAVVFVSSVHAHRPLGRACAYNAAKAGLNHFAKSIAVELFEHHIRVNVIEPGWIDTPAERAIFGDDVLDREGPTLPAGRLGRPDEIGKAAAFLCSGDADYINGVVLRVDGGITLRDCIASKAVADLPEGRENPGERTVG